MSGDDCGPDIDDIYSTEILRDLAHREALKRPDFDEFTTRVIAMVQLVEAQRKSAETLAAVDRNDREHWACDQQRIDRLTAENVRLRKERDGLRGQLDTARAAARAYAHQVNQLGLAVEDTPEVLATAGPIGAAQADLYIALGIYEERKPCGFGLDGGDCYACGLYVRSFEATDGKRGAP